MYIRKHSRTRRVVIDSRDLRLGLVRVQSNPWLVEQLRPFMRPRRKVGV